MLKSYTELKRQIPLHRAFSLGTQSFFPPVHRAFTPVHRAFSLQCTELRFGSLCNLGLSKKLRFSLQRHKTREFGEAEFSDCLPVSALVCVFAFDTGGLGLWGGQGFIGAKASLDPLCRFFVAQSFSPRHRAVF